MMFFCYDHFRSMYHQFGIGMSKAVKVHRLIEHCLTRLEVDKLLQQVEQHNPNQYARFKNQLTSHGS